MAKQKYYAFDDSGVRRIQEATRRVLDAPSVGAQRRRQPPAGGGGSCECKEVHRFWTTAPTAGTFKATYSVDGTSQQLSWAYNATDADVQTAFEAHSKIDVGDVKAIGGPWPSVAIYVRFQGDLAGISIGFPALDNTSLTNGKGLMDKYTAVDLFEDA